MRLNEAVDTNNTIGYGGTIIGDNIIYRYNGKYEPIFKDISLFSPTYIYNSVNSAHTEYEYNYWSSNYKFDYSLTKFGIIDELIFSKVNPSINPLKLKKSSSEKSIYQMVPAPVIR